jgi:hypothetical protein
MADARYPCPCCGYLTLSAPSPGSYEICPICVWEDSTWDDDWSGTNEVTLEQAQANFLAFGACEEAWKDEARAPTGGDVRALGWHTVEGARNAAREAARQAIEAAFGDLRRGDGMRIYDAELEDDYGSESARAAVIRDHAYQRWQEIPAAVIGEFYSVLSFFDPPGLRFHMAAYMTWSLTDPDAPGSNSADFTLYALDLGGKNDDLRPWRLERFEAFDADQSHAVALFLRFMGYHNDDAVDYLAARSALKGYWGRFETGELA